MIAVKLTKIESTHNNVRTKETVGDTPSLPVVGEPFLMYSESLTPGADLRIIRTTHVVSLENFPDGVTEFRTANSVYRLEEV